MIATYLKIKKKKDKIKKYTHFINISNKYISVII